MRELEPKVAIVRPHTSILRDPMVSEPYTQEILAAVLQSAGVNKVTIIDEMAGDKATPDTLSTFDVVCVSADTPTYPRANQIKTLCSDVRRSGSGNIKTVIGGPHVSALPEVALKDGWDVVCKGEGDLVIEDIVLEKQLGIVQGQRVTNLDKVPLPARDLIDTGIYGTKKTESGKPIASILTSRGCPNSCIYCYKGVFGNIVFYRSIDNIMEELYDIKKRGIDQVAVYDDTFTLKAERTIKLCERMKDLDMSWTCNSRVNTVTPDMLAAMKAGGCSKISFGLESADHTVLKSIQKGISLEQVEKAVQMSKTAGIPIRLYLMFGFWEDSNASIDATMKFLYRIQPDEVQLSLLVPLPGSQIYRDAAKYKIDLPDDLSLYYYAGLEGPHSFITHTKYLNQEQYLLAVERYKRELEEWKQQVSRQNVN